MGIDFQVIGNPDPDRKQTQQHLFFPLLDLIHRIIEEMLESGELVIVDGIVTIPGQTYTLPLEVKVEQ